MSAAMLVPGFGSVTGLVVMFPDRLERMYLPVTPMLKLSLSFLEYEADIANSLGVKLPIGCPFVHHRVSYSQKGKTKTYRLRTSLAKG